MPITFTYYGPDEDAADPVLLALWRAQQDDRAAYEAECAAERRFGC